MSDAAPLTAEVLASETRTALRIADRDAEGLDEAAAAVLALVSRYHGDPAEWDQDIRHGARMLTARVWRRRQSPGGVETYGDLGPVYVSRTDPDIAQLLKIGNYAPPGVA